MIDVQSKSQFSSLSPLSSRFAAEAERANIRRLRNECRGLSAALKFLKKTSKEYALIKSKFDIATEELECVLEDRSMFRSFTGVDEQGLSVDDCIASIPTPPLASASSKVASINSAGPHTKVNVRDCLSSIPTLPLASPADFTNNQTHGVSLNVEGNASSTPAKRKEVQKRQDELHIPEKYSLEWFQNKAENVNKETSARSLSGHMSKSMTNLRPRKSLPPEIKPEIVPQVRDNEGPHTNDLSAELEKVPKFSVEWFTIKRAIKDKEEALLHNSKADDDAFTEKLSKITITSSHRHYNSEGERKHAKSMDSQIRPIQQQQRLDMVLERSKALLDGQNKEHGHQPQPSLKPPTKKKIFDSTSKKKHTKGDKVPIQISDEGDSKLTRERSNTKTPIGGLSAAQKNHEFVTTFVL